MPIDNKTGPKSLAEAMDAGIAEASGGAAPAATTGDDNGAQGAGADGAGDADAGATGDDDGSGGDSGAADGAAGGVGDESGDAAGAAATGDGVEGDGAAAAAAAAGTGGAPSGEGSGDAGAAARVPVLNADGTPKLDKDGKPVTVEGPKAAAKAPDPINDPIPKDLKPATRDRMTALVATAKTLQTERDTAVAERDQHIAFVHSTGASPEQYADALGVLRLVNSEKPADRQAALATLQEWVTNLATELGTPVPGVDPLEGHDDLRAEVQSGDIKLARAQEIARQRNAQRIATARGEQRRQQTETAEQQQQAIAQGRADLNALEVELRTANPTAYAAKRATVIAVLQPLLSTIHPSKWASSFKAAYDKLPAPVAAPTPTPGGGAPARTTTGNAPMRSRSPAGGQNAEPKSMLDAINAGLADVGR